MLIGSLFRKLTAVNLQFTRTFTVTVTMAVNAPAVDEKGAYKRKDSSFRDWIKADGSTQYKPEANRYHLYVSYACPWASRALFMRSVKGLKDIISVDVVDWLLISGEGWRFKPEVPGATVDSVNGYHHLKQVYGDNYDGAVSVPVLFDKKTKQIVNNESSEILRMFNSEFNEFCPTAEQKSLDVYPVALRTEIDAMNDWIYPKLNNGVYKCGFAQKQAAYDEAAISLFEALDKLEGILSKKRYLTGNTLTEADIRLFVTLIRFDPVYHLHFKCNRKRIVDYPNIWAYVREIYQMKGVKETVVFDHIVHHYLVSHKNINPFSIVPINPIIDYEVPHGRKDM